MTQRSTLLIGYGNPAHGDDGLGQAFAERMAERNLEGLTVRADYQISADHALDMAQHDCVVFADALLNGDAPFVFEEIIDPKPEALGSHSVSPPAALALCALLFNAEPRTFVLGIRGDQFGDIAEGLSTAAISNLNHAEAFFARWYTSIGEGMYFASRTGSSDVGVPDRL
ncbi:MAG: hydrogenase maturation protease [Rhizobiales bacterium]|nr:hydrogenase maturation protease [Hyphomicrobiales bacterium]MBO6697934.1 hydrogenase maturation protease [Hyphomicrobiales bacterium]MBO6735812.1 hydrogenase maturation protease [Hyphomicrobiales bacterium]MBO6913823.1 hydrogenase maturation protease [Hyphomicrobiales bacterium]MBO6955526.1 hydrogenase maturation protease [Hyphomicrobiales bacterium]